MYFFDTCTFDDLENHLYIFKIENLNDQHLIHLYLNFIYNKKISSNKMRHLSFCVDTFPYDENCPTCHNENINCFDLNRNVVGVYCCHCLHSTGKSLLQISQSSNNCIVIGSYLKYIRRHSFPLHGNFNSLQLENKCNEIMKKCAIHKIMNPLIKQIPKKDLETYIGTQILDIPKRKENKILMNLAMQKSKIFMPMHIINLYLTFYDNIHYE